MHGLSANWMDDRFVNKLSKSVRRCAGNPLTPRRLLPEAGKPARLGIDGHLPAGIPQCIGRYRLRRPWVTRLLRLEPQSNQPLDARREGEHKSILSLRLKWTVLSAVGHEN